MPANKNIDRIADEFEAILLTGDRPSLSGFVERVTEEHRLDLLEALIPLDVTYCRQRDDHRQAEDYAEFGEKAVAIARREIDHSENTADLYKTIQTDGIAEKEKRTPPISGERIHYFGEYDLLEEIARGGMGVVYKARQTRLNRIVALKMILSGELAGAEEVRRFQTEAEAAANLDHPGIVPIFEIGEHNGQHYFSMGFVDGPSLQGKLAAGPLPASEAARLCLRVAEAVAYAHSKGVIHRDLKPANVLLDAQGEPRVTDFGLAKKVEGDSGLTRTGAVMGTPSYMPPEQALGLTNQIGPLADVYSLGAILYCLLTGKPPFQAATMVETLRQVIEREPASPRLLNPDVNIDLETLCLKCLEKEPSHRIESAEELAAELNRYLHGEPIRSRRLGPVVRVGRWMRRNRMPATILFLVAFSLIVIVGATGVARRSAASRELLQWSNSFEAGIERLQLMPEHLEELETLVSQITQREPTEGTVFRRRLMDAWTSETERAIRRPYLQEAAVERIESALAALEQRGSDQTPRLQTLLEQRKLQWQPIFRLQTPFTNLATVLAPALVEVRDGKLYRKPTGSVSESDSNTSGEPNPLLPSRSVVPTQFITGQRAQLEAVFDADWEQSEELGLSLNYDEHPGYDFLLRPAPIISADQEIPQELSSQAAVSRLTFAQARQPGGRVLIEIRRSGSPIQKHEELLEAIASGPLQIRVQRDRGELSLQINTNKPIEIRDPFPLGSAGGGVFALHWPSSAGLITLRAEEMLTGGTVTTLEQADELFEQARYDDALTLYNRQSLEDQEIEVQQEARVKAGLCLSHLNRSDEARQIFQSLLLEPGERWPPQAGVQLWLMLLRQNHYDDADAVYELLSSRFSFAQLAMLVPAEVRDEILAAYTGSLASIGNAISFRPGQIRSLERATAVDRLLSYDGRGNFRTQVELSRAYRFVDDYDSALTVLEPIVRTTYDPVAWRNYLRTLRFLGRTDEALQACNELLVATHSQERPNWVALQDRIYIHVARGDWDAAEGDVLKILGQQEVQTWAFEESHAYCSLLGGFLRADRGDEPGALAYWRQGYLQGRPMLARSVGRDSASICVLIMGALCGELKDEEGWRFFQAVIGSNDSPLMTLATQLVNQATVSQSLRRMWNTARGRAAARDFAYDRLSLRQRVEEPAKLVGAQYFADVALGGRPTPEQQEIAWQVMTTGLSQVVQEQRLNGTQVMQLGLSWKGTSNFLGWQGVASSIDPTFRGLVAYVLAHRYVRLNNVPQAIQFLEIAIQDASDQAPLAELAKAELELLKSGKARLRLQRLHPPEAGEQPIEIVLRRGAKEVQRIELGDQVEVDLPAGHYELKLAHASEQFALTATEVTLAVADRAVIHVELRWKPGPERGVLSGLLPRPADLPELGRWQVFASEPVTTFRSLAQSPSGDFVAGSGSVAEGDSVVRIYDRELNLLRAFDDTSRGIFDLSWSPDGDLLAIAGGQPSIDLWEPKKARHVARLPTPTNMSSVAWSPNGDRLAGGAWNGDLFVWDATGTLLTTQKQELGSVYEVAWSRDGHELIFITGDADKINKIGYWSLAEDAVNLLDEDSTGRWRNLSISPGGEYLASTDLQGAVIWDWPARRRVRTCSSPAKYTSSVCWAPEGDALWIRSDGRFSRFEMDSPGDAPATSHVIRANNRLLYDPQTHLFTGLSWPRQLVRFGEDGETIAETNGFQSPIINETVFHPDGQRFAMASDTSNIQIFDAAGGFQRRIELPSQSHGLGYSTDGTILVTACDDGLLRLFNSEDGKLVREWNAHAGGVLGSTFHPSGEKLASCGSDQTVRLWSVEGESLALLPTEPAQDRSLEYVSFSPDGTRLAAAGSHGDVLVWDEQGKLVGSFRTELGIRDLAWNADGSRLAVAAGQEIQIFSREGEIQAEVSLAQSTVVGCDWNTSGELLVVDQQGNVSAFDATGTVVAEWQLGVPGIGTVAFDPQGQQLLAAQTQAVMHGWNLSSRLPIFTTVLVDEKTLTFDAMGRLRNEGVDDISPLMYMVETPAGFRLFDHEGFTSQIKPKNAVPQPDPPPAD